LFAACAANPTFPEPESILPLSRLSFATFAAKGARL
jgi:hypothetical protein